jgi:hypothetical protein
MEATRRTAILIVAVFGLITTIAVLPAQGDTSTTCTFSGHVSSKGHRSEDQSLTMTPRSSMGPGFPTRP